MKKYLKSQDNQKIGNLGQNKAKKAKAQKSSDNEEEAFKEFMCPLCMKLIHKCVTTLCGHSYCDSCLDDYLIYK